MAMGLSIMTMTVWTYSIIVPHHHTHSLRGGRKGGNAQMAAEAEGHERVGGGRGGGGGFSDGRMELKGRGGVGGNQRQHMLMDEDEVREARGAAKPSTVGHAGNGGHLG